MTQRNTLLDGLARLSNVRSLALMGSYVPRQCGIATFTHDLYQALREVRPDMRIGVVAIDDGQGHRYPEEVQFQVRQPERADYRAAASFLHMAGFDALCIQHEFGVFGGPDGAHLLELLRHVRIPTVTALHTVPRQPTASQRNIVRELAKRSDRLVVMSATGRRFLTDIYGIERRRISVIPHGIPEIAFIDPNYYKDRFGVEGKRVILTFGLLSPNKGIETMIRALPAIVEQHPEAVYMIVGATHPHVRAREGERYRESLVELANTLGVEQNLMFVDRYVSLDELKTVLGAADVYVTPYPKEDQICSGTLAYAMAAGKAIVSTPYWYASEMLADERGCLVDFEDPAGFAAAVNELLSNEIRRHTMRKRAHAFMSSATWPEVGRRYIECFNQAYTQRNCTRGGAPRTPERSEARLPAPRRLDLRHLLRMTDDVGVVQHSSYHIPNRHHGYCTDDNARALIVALLATREQSNEQLEELVIRYFSFLLHAFERENGVFRNFMGYDRRFLERVGSPDSHGRAIWALGLTGALASDARLRASAGSLLHESLEWIEGREDLRALAFALLGLCSHIEAYPGDTRARRSAELLAERVYSAFRRGANDPAWPWPEEFVTYANARICHALLAAGQLLEQRPMIEQGLRSLDWLLRVQTEDGHFSPIGNCGWLRRGNPRARFDQQPLEAGSSVAACAFAWELTRSSIWFERAQVCFRWFLGDNDLGEPLIHVGSGGCRDGLGATGVNENEGAESLLAWFEAQLELRRLELLVQAGTDAVELDGLHRRPVRAEGLGVVLDEPASLVSAEVRAPVLLADARTKQKSRPSSVPSKQSKQTLRPVVELDGIAD